MIMDITYGHRIHSLDDHYVRLVQDTTSETVRAGSPGSMLVDFFPVCEFPPHRFVASADCDGRCAYTRQ